MLREIEILRSVASAAIRLRQTGIICEEIELNLLELWENNKHMTRSGTQSMMADQAFKTAMKRFDEAVEAAALARFDWANEWVKPMPRLAKEYEETESPAFSDQGQSAD